MKAWAWLLTVVLATGVYAQTEPHVAGSGREEVELLPTALRVVVRLQAEADTLEAAIADIQGQTAELLKKLGELNPREGTLVAEGPHTGQSGAERDMSMRRMMGGFDRMEPDDEEEGEKVTLSTTVKAEWALAATELVGLLREAEKVRQGVAKAVPEPAAADEEMDEEEWEEMVMMMEEHAEDALPGRPNFLFVARLPKDALAAAKSKAFRKAKEDAETTAAAAGLSLGRLMSLEAQVMPSGDEGYSMYYAMSMMGVSERPDETEAISPRLATMTFHVGISAEFSLGPSR